jgi:hypothetical protein
MIFLNHLPYGSLANEDQENEEPAKHVDAAKDSNQNLKKEIKFEKQKALL